MALENSIVCPYCGNPNPNYSRRTKRTSEILFKTKITGGNRGYESTVQEVPLVKCKLCDRNYYLYAQSKNKRFCKQFLYGTKIHGTVEEFMKSYGLLPYDIIEGFSGLTQVKSYTSCINGLKKKINYGDEIHLLFLKGLTTYCMTINHSKKGKYAVNMGIVL